VNKFTATSITIIFSIFMSSCLATQASQYLPALLERPSVDNRLLLESAIGDLLNSQPIKLANSVFILKSTIIIEPRQAKDSLGRLLDGRELSQADTVSLLTEDGKCYLKHNQSGRIKRLANINCKKE
jgi:hypothetical protein